MSTKAVYRWRVFCSTENKLVDGFLSESTGKPINCFNNIGHLLDTSKTSLVEIIQNDFTECVIKWRVYCETESLFVESYISNDLGTPNCCSNDDTHTISGIPEKIEVIRNKKRKVDEESLPNNGFFKIETLKMSIPSKGTITKDFTWPIDIAPLSVTLISGDVHKGDIFQVDVLPDTIIGIITSDTIVGENVLNVNSTVIENSRIGLICNLFDGVNFINLGLIIDIDRRNSRISTELVCPEIKGAFVTYVRVTMRYLGPHEMGDPGNFILGGSKIGSSHVRKGGIVRATYTNVSKAPKDLYMLLEMMY